MINEKLRALGAAPNKIRETFAYGLERKAEIGADKVFDLSIGNPSVPSPAIVDETIARLATESKGRSHGYTPSPGLIEVRNVIAENLNERFGTDYSGENLYLTSGASSALTIVFKGLVCPGECVMTVAPYFTEYKTWTEAAGGTLIEVPARQDDFQMDVPAMERAMTDKVSVVIINSPNNPVGSIYSDDNLKELAAMLERKEKEYGHPIYLLSDEPYRELYYYEDEKPAWVPDLYRNTIVTYSWSKSLTLPGERIAYILVPGQVEDWKDVYNACAGAGRALGYICASTTFQHVVAECIDTPVNKAPYDENRKFFMQGLDEIGYTYVKPQGAFYMWIKSLEPDDNAFYEAAKRHELLLVPGSGFGGPGWVRAGYCCSKQTIAGALGAFKELWDEYHA